jgi:glycosyltransferase involved in cell wall biosynthesis
MTRPVAYDATHLVTRLDSRATTGIDGVDLAYARHFVQSPQLACGVHYGLTTPHVLARARLEALVERATAHRENGRGADSAAEWESVRAWLSGNASVDPKTSRRDQTHSLIRKASAWPIKAGLRLAHDPPYNIPDSAIYLNIAQHAFEYPLLFEWLARRDDVRAVFFVHDLLPLDYPEFFRSGYEARFRRRVETILRHAKAVITTSRAVAERVEREFAASGKPMIPVHVAPLPSPLETSARAPADRELADCSYFVVVATLEPRKNHLMLLNVWRSLATMGEATPKLVLVGNPGWENEQTIDVLRRSKAIRPHVRWVGGLSPNHLRDLLANARALLMPSFAEGYGLPIVEAMSLGVPAIVSDIPVFREVAQGRATFLSPIDASGWRQAILDFSDAGSARRRAALEQARDFAKPGWPHYFGNVEEFLNAL